MSRRFLGADVIDRVLDPVGPEMLARGRVVAELLATVVVGFAMVVILLVRIGGSDPRSASAAGVVTSPTATPASTLPADVQAQLDALSPGTVIVPCNSSEARLPEGGEPGINPAFSISHPGWHFLFHGYCADNPSATPLPVIVPVLP